MARRIFITVAEVSGDKHAAQLVRELRKLDPDLIIEGVGGPEMVAAGATVHRNTVTKAAMGIKGLLRAGEVYGLLRETRKRFDDTPPDLWVGVDSPSMNFHFARAAHERGIPTLQYVAPQLWAWARWRMKKLRWWIDQVACILPFEEAYFRKHGVNATFVGHPLFDELPPRQPVPIEQRFPNRPLIVGLLAGSRKSEAQANFPGLLGAAQRIAAEFSGATFLAPTTAGTQPIVRGLLNATAESGVVNAHGVSVEFGQDRFDEMVPRCDLCLTVSGTATLHVASFNVPMVVVYYVTPIIAHTIGRLVVPTKTFALVNVLAKNSAESLASPDGHIVPEVVPWNGKVEPVADHALDLLRHPEDLESQRSELAKLVTSLDRAGASANVAKLALGMMKTREATPAPP